MTKFEFRRDENLVAQWAEMLRTNALLRLIVFDVMEHENPARFAIDADNNGDISPTRAGVELGMTRGYNKYGDTLKLLTKPLPASQVNQLPETTYEPEKSEAATRP